MYTPRGTTDNGKCNNGQCGLGFWKNGRFNHYGRLARQPRMGPRGKNASKLKNSLPRLWMEEVAKTIQSRALEGQDVVIDLFSGWQSWRPVCEENGWTYIGVDNLGLRG